MKKLGIITLILVLTCSLCACGRRNKQPETTTPPAATPAPTAPNNFDNDPTMDTNIPDPEVNPNSTMPEGFVGEQNDETNSDIGNESDTGSQTPDTNENSRSRMRKMN